MDKQQFKLRKNAVILQHWKSCHFTYLWLCIALLLMHFLCC